MCTSEPRSRWATIDYNELIWSADGFRGEQFRRIDPRPTRPFVLPTRVRHGRFPRGRDGCPDEEAGSVARQLKHCREGCVEPPTPDRITRMVSSVLHSAEGTWFARIVARLEPEVREGVLGLVVVGAVDGAAAVDEDADGGSVPAQSGRCLGRWAWSGCCGRSVS